MNLEAEPTLATRLCVEAQQRLERATADLDDVSVRAPSLLPGWSRAHVLTHLARNADAHARRIEGALNGRDVPKYRGGSDQRLAEIEQGASRTAATIQSDLMISQTRLGDLLHQACAADWPNAHFTGGGHYGVSACPAHRLREVEMHHVDLGAGYLPADWPDEYVEWEMTSLLTSLPERMHNRHDRQTFLAWLAGRGPVEETWHLSPWG